MMIFSLFLLLQINFASMQLTEKKSRHKKNLRRSHFEGVYAQVALSEHLTSVEARINGFQVRSISSAPEEVLHLPWNVFHESNYLLLSTQIDNQLPFALNPTIIYAFPTPPKVASKYGIFFSALPTPLLLMLAFLSPHIVHTLAYLISSSSLFFASLSPHCPIPHCPSSSFTSIFSPHIVHSLIN